MRRSYLETSEDFQWLKDVHGVDATGAELVEIVGNEDFPYAILVFERNHVDCVPTHYAHDVGSDSYKVVTPAGVQ